MRAPCVRGACTQTCARPHVGRSGRGRCRKTAHDRRMGRCWSLVIRPEIGFYPPKPFLKAGWPPVFSWVLNVFDKIRSCCAVCVGTGRAGCRAGDVGWGADHGNAKAKPDGALLRATGRIGAIRRRTFYSGWWRRRRKLHMVLVTGLSAAGGALGAVQPCDCSLAAGAERRTGGGAVAVGAACHCPAPRGGDRHCHTRHACIARDGACRHFGGIGGPV